MKKKHYRSIFISDTHLGFRGCQAEWLNKFLKSTEAENYFLLGDIIDLWSFKETRYWKETHTEVLKTLLKKSMKSKVTYVPGNHDYDFRRFDGMSIGNISLQKECLYESLSGNVFLLTHGDLYDSIIQKNKILVHLGCYLYDRLIIISHYLSVIRSMAGRVHWSLSKFLKKKVKLAVSYINDYEECLVEECNKRGIDGVICGHIHNPEIKGFGDSLIYMNCGDWVETCSAIVETLEGEFQLIELSDDHFVTANVGV